MTAELLNNFYVILLISFSLIVLGPVFYWLFTDGGRWQQNRA